MTSNNDRNHINTLTNDQNDTSAEVIIKAIKYPPGYPDNKQKEQCNKKEEKHKDCHPMHCHHMQPMQSTTTTPLIDNPDHVQHGSMK